LGLFSDPGKDRPTKDDCWESYEWYLTMCKLEAAACGKDALPGCTYRQLDLCDMRRVQCEKDASNFCVVSVAVVDLLPGPCVAADRLAAS